MIRFRASVVATPERDHRCFVQFERALEIDGMARSRDRLIRLDQPAPAMQRFELEVSDRSTTELWSDQNP